MKKKSEKIKTFEIEEHTRFELANIANVERIASALAQAGYFIHIRRESEFYTLIIFRHTR